MINAQREVTRRLPGANVVNALGYPEVAPAMQKPHIIVGRSGFTENLDCEACGEIHTFIAELISLGMCHSARTLVYSERCLTQQSPTIQDAFKLIKAQPLHAEWSLFNVDIAQSGEESCETQYLGVSLHDDNVNMMKNASEQIELSHVLMSAQFEWTARVRSVGALPKVNHPLPVPLHQHFSFKTKRFITCAPDACKAQMIGDPHHLFRRYTL